MFHIDFESKRFKTGLRYFTYGIMTMATVILTAVIILLALGYRFDRDHFSVVRQGLLQLASHPEDMQYSIDGQDRGTTPARISMEAKTYDLQMHKDGYRSWQKNITVEEGQVHWINYPRLIPDELTTNSVKKYDGAITFAKVAPEKRWLLVKSNADPQNQLELIDLEDPQNPNYIPLTVPEEQLTKIDGNLGTLQLVEWSLNADSFILRHTNGEISEYIVVPRENPDEAVNLNKQFQLVIDDVHFSGGNTDILYARTGEVLRRFNVSDNVASGVLINGIRDFEIYGDDTLIFSRIAKQSGNGRREVEVQQVGIKKDDKELILEELPASNEVTVAYNEFDNHAYFVVANRTQGQVHIYKDPETKEGKTYFVAFSDISPEFVRFNGNGRFVMLQQGNKFGVYDFYEEQKYTYNIPDAPGGVSATWIDDFHLVTSIKNTLHFWDFDGTNMQQLMNADSRFDPVMNDREDLIFAFNRMQDKKVELTSTSITLEQ